MPKAHHDQRRALAMIAGARRLRESGAGRAAPHSALESLLLLNSR
jgi:hypothetical protein